MFAEFYRSSFVSVLTIPIILLVYVFTTKEIIGQQLELETRVETETAYAGPQDLPGSARYLLLNSNFVF